MPEYLHPGVYVEEIAQGPRPIEGVPTSIAAFIGGTERGPMEPRLVTSRQEYRRWFGGAFDDAGYMPYAVNGFFENGGKRLYVCRITGATAMAAEASFGGFIVRAIGPGSWGKRIFVKIEAGSQTGFRLRLAYYATLPEAPPLDWFDDATKAPIPTLAETFDDLELDEQSPNFWSKQLSASALVTLERRADAPPGEIPAPAFGALTAHGTDGDAAPDIADYQGALVALERDPYRDVSLVYAPGASAAVNQAVIDHCETLRFRFAVVDPEQDVDVTTFEPRGAIQDTQHAALYYPWIVVPDLETGAQKVVPPGGHVLGVYARTDSARGVFKAPANEVLQGVAAPAAEIGNARQERMNPLGINAIRRFPQRGIRVWGARTLASDALWKYVNVKRLFIFLERSIHEGTQWVVFEPNDERLWARVRDTVGNFLHAQWRAGALTGQKAEEAYFIRCDRTTMTEDDILNGRLICEIGIAPLRPAEFVIFRIFQNTFEAQR